MVFYACRIQIFSLSQRWKEVAPLPVGRTAHTAVFLHGSVMLVEDMREAVLLIGRTATV